jgi:hypothetical protein
MDTAPESGPDTEAVPDDDDLADVQGGAAILGMDAAGAAGAQPQRFAR